MALLTKAAAVSSLLQVGLKSLESKAVVKLATAAAASQAEPLKKDPRNKKFAIYRWVSNSTLLTKSPYNSNS